MAVVNNDADTCPTLMDTLCGLHHALSPSATPDDETKRLLATSKGDVRDLCVEALTSEDQKEAMYAGLVLSLTPALYTHPKDEWERLVAELTATLREMLSQLFSCCHVPPVVLLEGEGERVWSSMVECGEKDPDRTERIVARIRACGHSLACCLRSPSLVGAFHISPQSHFLLIGAAWRVNWHTLAGIETTEVCLLRHHLPNLYLTFWELMEATVCLMKCHIMKYRDLVEGYIVDALTWTAGVPEEKVAEFVSVRTAVYTCTSALSQQTHDMNTRHCSTLVTHIILDTTVQQKSTPDKKLSSAAVNCLHSVLVYTHVDRETAAEIGDHIADMVAMTTEQSTLCVLGACVVELLRSGCVVPDISAVLAALREKSPRAYMETSHTLGSIVNPGRPVFAAAMLGGEVPSGLHLPGINIDRLQGPSLLTNSGPVTQDSARPIPKEASPGPPPPPPPMSSFPMHRASDLTTPHNGHNWERAPTSPIVLNTPALPTGPPAFTSTVIKPTTLLPAMEVDTITIVTEDEADNSPLPFQPNLIPSDDESD